MRTILLAVILLSVNVLSVRAQMTHTHPHDPADQLGVVNFKTSCTPQAQKQFNRAVAWLHSFEYEEAEHAFTEVTVTDPVIVPSAAVLRFSTVLGVGTPMVLRVTSPVI